MTAKNQFTVSSFSFDIFRFLQWGGANMSNMYVQGKMTLSWQIKVCRVAKTVVLTKGGYIFPYIVCVC